MPNSWRGDALQRILLAAVLPVFYIVVHQALWPGPISVFNWGEPDFGYLFNSADLRIGAPPGHTDHPGTTVQSLGVAVLAVAEFFRKGAEGYPGWYDDFLLHPAQFHQWNSIALAVIVALGLWAMGVAFLRRGHGLGLVVFLQLLPFLEYNSWYYVPRVSPEKLLFFLNCALAGFLATREGEERARPGFAMMLGFLLGFALATKYNCLTLFGFLLLLPRLSLFFTGAASALLSFFVFTLPMAGVYSMSFDWLRRLTGHQGMYGKGEKGAIPAAQALAENFRILFQDDSIFLVACLGAVLLAVLLAWRRRARDPIVCALILTAHFAMVLKHPASRYLIPMVAPLLLVAFHAVRSLPRIYPWLAAAAILPAIPNVVEVPIMGVWGVRTVEPAMLSLDGWREKHPECLWAYISPVARVEWALSAGNGSAFKRHTIDLVRLYPQALSFDVSPPRFHRFSSTLPDAVVEERVNEGKGCLYLGGISYLTAVDQLKRAPFRYELVHNEENGPYVLKVTKFAGSR